MVDNLYDQIKKNGLGEFLFLHESEFFEVRQIKHNYWIMLKWITEILILFSIIKSYCIKNLIDRFAFWVPAPLWMRHNKWLWSWKRKFFHMLHILQIFKVPISFFVVPFLIRSVVPTSNDIEKFHRSIYWIKKKTGTVSFCEGRYNLSRQWWMLVV